MKAFKLFGIVLIGISGCGDCSEYPEISDAELTIVEIDGGTTEETSASSISTENTTTEETSALSDSNQRSGVLNSG